MMMRVAPRAGQVIYLVGIPQEAAPARIITKTEKARFNESEILRMSSYRSKLRILFSVAHSERWCQSLPTKPAYPAGICLKSCVHDDVWKHHSGLPSVLQVEMRFDRYLFETCRI